MRFRVLISGPPLAIHLQQGYDPHPCECLCRSLEFSSYAEDIAAAAKDINEERQRAYDAQVIEDAKAVLARAGEQEAEAAAQ